VSVREFAPPEPHIPDEFAPDAPLLGGVRAVSASAFLAESIAEPRWLSVDIVPEGAIGFIGGAPKVLKSWIALDLAFAVAAGGAFCGRFLCAEPRRVLLMQFESSRAAFQRRVRALSARYGAPPDELWIVSNESVLFEDAVSVQRMNVLLERTQPALLVLDPLASMTTGEENSATEMGRVVRQLRSWRDTHGCAIAVVHHTNKGAAGVGAERVRSGMKLRGSSAFYAATEWALWIERPDESAPRIEVRVEQKESEPRRPFAVAFDESRAELAVIADSITMQVTDDDIVDAIVERKRRATAKELAADLGIAETTIRDRMTSLVSQRRAYFEAGTGRGRKALVYVVPKGTQSGPRLLSEREP
jgi:hypothetical protein